MDLGLHGRVALVIVTIDGGMAHRGSLI